MSRMQRAGSTEPKLASITRAAIPAFALLVAMIVYARGLFTPLGIRSFGREFGWYVNYLDFGFAHRALIGTIVVLFAPGPIANSYVIPYAVYPFFLVFTVVAGLLAARRWFPKASEQARYLAVLLLSPAFVTHYAYSTGDFNVLLAVILIASLLLVRYRFVPFALLLLAMAIHEIFFVVFAPCVCVAIYLTDGRLGRAVAYAVAGAVLLLAFAHFGTIQMSSEQFLSTVHQRVNTSYNAYFEMTAGLKSNIEYTRPLFSSFGKIAWITPLVIYWIIVVATFFPLRQSGFIMAIYVAATGAPLVLIPLGTDLFRWVALACVCAIVLGGFLQARGFDSLFRRHPRLALALTLPWFLAGPFGATCDPFLGCLRAFPMSQFVLERL